MTYATTALGLPPPSLESETELVLFAVILDSSMYSPPLHQLLTTGGLLLSFFCSSSSIIVKGLRVARPH